MKKVIINENQKGFLFHNGRFVKLLGAGKYPLFGAREIEIVSLKEPLMSAKCELDTLLANSEVAKLTSVCEVADQQLALHYTSGKCDGVLRRGKYAFWSVLERHEYQLVDISTPEVAEDVPQYIFAQLPTTVYTKVEVAQYQKARLYFDQKLIRILDAGTYYFWKNKDTCPESISFFSFRIFLACADDVFFLFVFSSFLRFSFFTRRFFIISSDSL